jgi:ABC-type multidrug transport system ATPase subunit
MGNIAFESVSKSFLHRPRLFPFPRQNALTTGTRALRDVNLSLPAGSILVLLGPNGSGKTTLLRLISTMLLPDKGRVLVGGRDTRTDPQGVRRQVGFAFAAERSFFPRLTAAENLNFFAALDDIPRTQRPARIAAMLDRTGLSHAPDTLVMNFSSGMYQRLAIARALLKRPEVLLLDEPTRSLDPASNLLFWELIRELPTYGTTVVIASHSFSETAAVADWVAFLNYGTVTNFRRAVGMNASDIQSLYFRANPGAKESYELVLESCG